MGYALIDSGMDDHPKVLELLEHEDGLAAWGLWTACLLWARRQVEAGAPPDRWGVIPATLPRRFGASLELTVLLVEARAGRAHGLWDANGTGWRIHDFAERQDIAGWLARKEQGRRAVSARRDRQPRQTGPDLFGTDVDADVPTGVGTGVDAAAGTPVGTPVVPISVHISSVTRQEKPSAETLARFGEFWDAYGHKVAKGAAERAWAKAVRLADPETIITAARAYAASRNGQDPHYTKHPATWLNAKCWEDDPPAEPPGGYQEVAPGGYHGRGHER